MCCVEELKKSPLFAISRCGIELAHSNFWKWLIDIEDDKRNHPFIEVFIPDFYNNGYSFSDVKREEWHRDLSIHYKDEQNNAYCFVVENKIKSIPTQKQLDHYKDKIESAKGEKFGGGVLTGIVETLTPKNGWKFLSYKEIAARIENINDLQEVNIGNFYYETIAQYVKDLRNIDEIISRKDKEGEYNWSADEELKTVKLEDIYLKFQGCKLKAKIECLIESNNSSLNSKWGLPEVELCFNNKAPTNTVVYKQKGNDGKELGRIGVQIEGDQFRIYGGPSFPESPFKDPKKLYDEFIKTGYFEEYDMNLKKINEKESKMTKEYCKYETKDYTHIYQYWNLKDHDIDIIGNQVIEQIKKAKEQIEEKNITFEK